MLTPREYRPPINHPPSAPAVSSPTEAPTETRGTRTRLPKLLLAGGSAFVILTAAACDRSSPVPDPVDSGPSATRTAAATSSATTIPDAAAVAAVYRAFWPVLTTFDRYPEAQWSTALGRVSVDPQLSQAIAVAREQRRNGITLYGQPQPRTPRIAIDSKAKATLMDCVDFSRSGQADAKTGQRKTVGLARTRMTLVLAKGSDGWRVSAVTFPGGAC